MPYTSPSTPILSGSSSLDAQVSVVAALDIFKPNLFYSDPFFVPAATTEPQAVYRGFLSGEYVYSVGSPPPGASDIIIVGYE